MSATPTSTTRVGVDDNRAGIGQKQQNQSIEKFAASLSTAAVIFGVQIIAFLILSGNWKLRRSKKDMESSQPTERQSLFHKIYYYKTAFVSKRKRIAEPSGAIQSFKNVFTVSDRDLIRVAGVDGYLFLEYLSMLLRVFIPMALVILPILLPINRKGDVPDVSGLDSFAWPNVSVPSKLKRLWAHLVLSICVVVWVCYNVYLALRKFVRLRQTILTMPEHRIRASATTILVQTIPRKWLTMAALDALYDVFPGGIRDIWINRNFDELNDKVNHRIKIARALEAAETNLILECHKRHQKMEAKKAKQAGIKKSKKQRKQEEAAVNDEIAHSRVENGITSGNPHQIEQTLQDVLVVEDAISSGSSSSSSSRSSSPDSRHKKSRIPIPLVGDGIQAVGDGFRDVGKLGNKMVGGLRGAFGGRHGRGDSVPQADATHDNYATSPLSVDYPDRGVSTDTHTPLNEEGGKEKYDVDGSGSEPNSPPAAGKAGKERKSKDTNPLAAIKDSPINPLRKISDFASPQPFRKEGEEFPMEADIPIEEVKYDYAGVYNGEFAEDPVDAVWRKYLKPKDRETMRVPLFNKRWWPSLPLLGKKVDTIYYLRKELARLNHEIADDQAHPERFPLMNSAFIQFNHQVAAHMACQSLSHHIPRQMAPRTVEVNPNYVIWDNLTMSWYMRYLRMFGVIILIMALIIGWGIPVSFSGALSNIAELEDTIPWLAWLNELPDWLKTFLQGVLPPALLGILFAILPIVLRFLAEVTGTTTTGERELLVQNFYFAFVFIQLFLVVSISTGLTAVVEDLIDAPTQVPQILAQNLPKAANYFYSYMILQALSISSGTLLQIATVLILLFSRFLDTTPRQKVSRVLSRPGINWGNMIPVYTNFACIGMIYSVVSPFIMIMMIITFSLFWFTYRYQMLYVSYAKAETNGLIFPRAVNQLFTGLYFMELCMVGLYFIQKGPNGGTPCFPQAIIMIIVLGFTVIFQVLINRAFSPLFTYLPITFEDEAVERDEEFQRAQAARWANEHDEHTSLNAELKEREKQEWRESKILEEEDERQRRNSLSHPESYEMNTMAGGRSPRLNLAPEDNRRVSRKTSWAERSRSSRSRSHGGNSNKRASRASIAKLRKSKTIGGNPLDRLTHVMRSGVNDVLDEVHRPVRDIEAQVLPSANLFDDIDDTLEDIEPEARQKLIKRAFQHPATRAIQPCVWIPHDVLGVANDEIRRTAAFSERIWISSENAMLDASGRVMYRGLPPDRDPFENIEV